MASREQHTDVQQRETPRRRVIGWDDIGREVKHLEIDYVRCHLQTAVQFALCQVVECHADNKVECPRT